MKKLFITLFIAVSLSGCSSDDSSEKVIDGVEVLSFKKELRETTDTGYLFTFTATVKNHTEDRIRGEIKFLPKLNPPRSTHSSGDITILPYESREVEMIWTHEYPTTNFEITEISFEEHYRE